MNIAVFGAGVAGLMTAIALSSRGHQCKVYERSHQVDGDGMGLIVLSGALDDMVTYGVQFADYGVGIPLHFYRHRNSEGDILHCQNMPRGALGIRRSDLIAAMVSALPGSTVTYGDALESLHMDDTGRIESAQLTSGRLIIADIYVAADGVRSCGRHTLFPNWPTSTARVLELVGMVRSSDVARWSGENLNKFHDPDGGLAFGILPVGPAQAVWYLQFDFERFSAPLNNAKAKRSFAFQLVGNWADPVAAILSSTDFSHSHLWRPVDAELVPHFYQKNLVLVGDAAHPLSPFTSQGTSTAIRDAVALGDALDSLCLRDALATYSVVRRAECARFVSLGRKLCSRFLTAQTPETDLLPMAK